MNFAPPFILYLNVENAQNPVQQHFEKSNIKTYKICMTYHFALLLLPFYTPIVQIAVLKQGGNGSSFYVQKPPQVIFRNKLS